MKMKPSQKTTRARSRGSRVARMTRQALSAMLIGHFAFTGSMVNAVQYDIDTDTDGFFELLSNDVLNVEAGVIFSSSDLVPEFENVYVGDFAENVVINNYGEIFSTVDAGGIPKYGITVGNLASVTLNNAVGAVINTSTGIYSFGGDEIVINNDGIILGSFDAPIWVEQAMQLTVENTGLITGYQYGIYANNNEEIAIDNATGGIIEGDIGIVASGGLVSVANSGTIEAFDTVGNIAVDISAFSGAGIAAFANRNGGEVIGDVHIEAYEHVLVALEVGSTLQGDLYVGSFDSFIFDVGGANNGNLSDIIQGDIHLGVLGESLFRKSGSGTLVVDRALDTDHFAVSEGLAVIADADGINGQHVLLGVVGEPENNDMALQFNEVVNLESFEWVGGGLFSEIEDGITAITVANAFIVGSGEKEWTLSLDTSNLVEFYTLIEYGTGVFDIDDFLLSFVSSNPNATFSYELSEVGNSIVLQLGVNISDNLLQNSAGTPTFAVFTAVGAAETGDPFEDNIIRGLAFEDDSSLLIHNTLTVTDGELNVQEGSASISGDVLETPGDLVKTGYGALVLESGLDVNAGDRLLVLEGELTLNGDIDVATDVHNTSVLRVSGFLSAGDNIYNTGIFVANGVVESPSFLNAGFLGGSGIIYGNVLNSGYVNPGNSPGTLTIVGNYTQASTGTLLVEVESESNHDRLWVTGNAHLDGTLAVGGKLEFGDKYRFLRASSITGEFDKIIAPSGFRVRLLEKKTSLTALIAPEKYSDVARGDNHRSTARALDHFIDATSGDKETVSIALDHLRADEYANAFQQISPAFHETIGIQAVNLTQQQGRLLQQRIGTSRYGIRGFRSSTVETTLQTDRDGKSVSQSKAVKEVITTTEDPNLWSVWLEGNGIFSKVTQAHQVSNGKTRAGGFTLGADYAWNPNFITGLFAGYEGLETKHDDLSRTTMNGSRFGGYATYNLDSGLYFDGIAWGGVSEYKSHRRIKFGSIDRTATADQQAGEISALIGTGYDFKPGNWIMGPTASLQYTYVGIKGFEEDGAKSLNLDIDRQRIHSLRSNLGARIAYRYEVSSDLVIVPELRASWEYEFANDVRTINAQLGGKDVRYRTSSQERASLFAGAGVNALFNNRVSTSLNYNVDVGRSNDTAHIISASFGVNW